MRSEKIHISIVSACRNEASHIHDFVASLLAQDFGDYSWEAIIADGMSTDGTRDELDRLCTGISHLQVISNPGKIVSTGLNAAIRHARGDFILRLDAHTTYAPDYCVRCVETLRRTGADNVGGAARTRAKGLVAGAVAAAYHSRFSTGGASFHDEDYEGFTDTVPYGCWRKEKLEAIGLFDEALVRNQDDELNLRLLRCGGKIWQSRDIVSWYSPRSTLSGLFRQYCQYGFWKVAVIRKHRIPGSWRHLVPVCFVLANLLLPSAVVLSMLLGQHELTAVAVGLWGMLVATYFLATLAASLAVAHRRGWRLFPVLPATFATYHLSYGLGFLTGITHQASPPQSRPGEDSAFTRITR
jgi:succinoglycan biosynthesis protein ExoA